MNLRQLEKRKIDNFFNNEIKIFICTQSGPVSYNFILKHHSTGFPINVCFVNRSDHLIKFIKKYIN